MKGCHVFLFFRGLNPTVQAIFIYNCPVFAQIHRGCQEHIDVHVSEVCMG